MCPKFSRLTITLLMELADEKLNSITGGRDHFCGLVLGEQLLRNVLVAVASCWQHYVCCVR